jgi:carboxylate-amine ligase
MVVFGKEIPTVGVEEEFQIVDRKAMSLIAGYEQIAETAHKLFPSRIKDELYQCFLECTTDICPNIETVSAQTMSLRATLAKIAQQHGMALIAAATHPRDMWFEHQLPDTPRYDHLIAALQSVVRSRMIFGLHVHIGIQDADVRIAIMNQARTYLPHILALSANSPFWMGRNTGWLAYRTMIWGPPPWVGIPDAFANAAEYSQFHRRLFNSDIVKHSFHIWWDIKPHEIYPTLEFRIADMPLYHADMIAIVALVQALVKKLLWLNKHKQSLSVLPTALINENKWRAARWGLRGFMRDWDRESEIATVDALNELLAWVREVADEIGVSRYLAHIQSMLEPGYLCGAELQLQTFERHQSIDAVISMLMLETLRGVDMSTASL